MESDADSRVTIPLKLGERRAKIYHTLLIVLGWSLMLIFTFFNSTGLLPYLYVITLPLYIIHLTGVWKFSGKELDPMLPLLVMSTFLLALLAGAGFILQ